MRSAASIGLDRALAGAEAFTEYQVASIGATVLVRALSDPELEQHRTAAFASVPRSTPSRARWPRICAELQQRVLAVVCHLPGDGGAPSEPLFASPSDVANAPAALVVELWRAHVREMEAVHVAGAWYRAALEELASVEHADDLDRLRAQYAPGLVAFYGLPSARHASAVQVLHYHHLLTPKKAP